MVSAVSFVIKQQKTDWETNTYIDTDELYFKTVMCCITNQIIQAWFAEESCSC